MRAAVCSRRRPEAARRRAETGVTAVSATCSRRADTDRASLPRCGRSRSARTLGQGLHGARAARNALSDATNGGGGTSGLHGTATHTLLHALHYGRHGASGARTLTTSQRARCIGDTAHHLAANLPWRLRHPRHALTHGEAGNQRRCCVNVITFCVVEQLFQRLELVRAVGE